MGDHTGIEWTDATWNPIVGCSIVSPGCTNCYAMKQAARLLDGSPKAPHYAGTTRKVNGQAVWTGKVALAPEHILTQPLRWKRSRRIFVNSMGDLFHEDVPNEWINQVFAVMALAPQHTFQVLTKRSSRMQAYLTGKDRDEAIGFTCHTLGESMPDLRAPWHRGSWLISPRDLGVGAASGLQPHQNIWPLPNVWLGVSAEDQRRFDERADDLGSMPAAVRFFSFEPLLGPIDASALLRTGKFHWAIVGGESGPNARPMHADWERSIRLQCLEAGVAYLGKQWGEWAPGGDWYEHHPTSLEVRGWTGSTWSDDPAIWSDAENYMVRLGKKRAGRLFDSAEHNGFPEVPA